MSEENRDSLEVERMNAELERDIKRWRVRRRLAIAAFVVVVVIAAFYMIAPTILPTPSITNLKEFNSITITVIGFCSSIVMLYIGAATYSDSHGTKVTSK